MLGIRNSSLAGRDPNRWHACDLGTIVILCVIVGFLSACGSQPAATATAVRVTEVPPTAVPWQPSRGVINVASAAQVARIGSLIEHNATVNQYLFARKTSTLWTRDAKGQIYAWTLLTGKPLYAITNAGNVRHMLLTADEAQLVTVGLDRTLRIFDAQNGNPVSQLIADQDPFSFNVNALDASALALTSITGKTTVWRPATARGPQFTLPSGPEIAPVGVAIAPDGSTLAVATSSNQVRFYDGRSGAPAGNIRTFAEPIRSLIFTPDGTRLAAAIGATVTLISVDGAAEPTRLTADSLAADRGMVFSPNGQMLATASSKDFVYIWNLQNGALLARLPGHGESALWFTWSPDSTLLITVAYGPRGAAYLWDASTFKPQNTQYQRGQLSNTADQIFSAAWSPDGQTILLGDARGTVFAYGIPPR